MIYGKFIDSSTVTGTQIRLDNEQYLRARNFANNADVSILRVTSTNVIEFKQIPYVEGQGRLALYSELEGLQVSVDYLYGQISGITSSITAIEEEIDVIQGEIDALEAASGTYALKDLSNLTPTSIPSGVNLESLSIVQSQVTGFLIKTRNQTTSVSGSVAINSGTSTGAFASGFVNLVSGSSSNAVGAVSTTTMTGAALLGSGSVVGGTRGSSGSAFVRSGGVAVISSADSYSGNTGTVGVVGGVIQSSFNGATVTGNSGNASLSSGGIIATVSGATASGNSGNVLVSSGGFQTFVVGAVVSGNSGSVSLQSGSVSGLGTSTVNTGSSALTTGGVTNASNVGSTGTASMSTGQNGGIGNSGSVSISTGNVINPLTTSINFSGAISAITGKSIRATSGPIILQTGEISPFGFNNESNVDSFTGVFSVTTGAINSALNTGSTGDVLLYSGSHNGIGNTGAVNISSGSQTGAGNSGSLNISSGSAGGNSGDVNISTGVASGTRGNIYVTAPFLSLQNSTRVEMIKSSSDILARFQIDNGSGNYGQFFFNRFPSSSNIYIGAMESAIDDNGADVVFSGAWSMSNNDGIYTSSRVFLQTNANSGFNDAPNVSVNSGDLSITTGNAFVQGSYTDANSGNILIYTGLAQGSGTRGYIYIDAAYVSMNSKQIKDLADGTAPQDAVTVSQLGAISGSYALTDLSNLVATAIPDGVGLESVSQTGFELNTKDQVTGNTGGVSVFSGDASLGDSGDVSIYSGDASNSSGNILISTGTASSGATKGGISLNAQSTTVFLTNFSASGANSIFNVQNLAGASSFQVLHYAEESNNSVGIRIFEGSPTSGFSINGWGQLNQNGGPFNFRSTKAYTSTGGSFSGGDFNIISASTDYIDPSVNSEISSGNINISTENAYVSGTGANANTGSIYLTTGTPQGTGTRGSVLLDGRVVSADVDVHFKVTNPSSASEVWLGNTSYGQLGGPYLYALGIASDRRFEIGGQGIINQNPGLTEFHGAAITSSIDGSYVSGEIDIYTKIETGTNATNASYSSGNINIYSDDADVYGLGYPDANTGNVNISTGTPQGSGNSGNINITTGTPFSGFRGSVNVNAYDMNVTPSVSGSFNVMSPSGVSVVSINNQGFSLPNSPAILFSNIPQTSVAIFQLYSDLNNNGATFYFSGTMVNAIADGSYTGGTVNMTSGGAGDITPANASISSADFNISSANAFVSGSFTDANSGNINISTGNKEGAGTRGYISLSASYINANLAQIKNVADPSDPQDALTLNYFNNNIPSVAANNFYDLQAYNTYAPIYADGEAGILDPVTPTNPRAGWYFKNTAGSPQKINWYFFDGTVVSCQLQNFSAFAVMTFDSVAEIPIMVFYTFPTGSGDIIPTFAHSRVVYSAPAVPSPVVGTKYLVYFGQDPEIFPYLPRIELTYNAVQSGGDQGATELVSTAAFSSDSSAGANNVQWMVENLGINTPSFKAFFKLLIFPVFEESQDFYGSFYSSQTQDNLVGDVARAMTFNNTDEANGVSIVSNSQITFDSAGLYNIQFSAQFSHSNSSSQDIDIWLSKNGTNVAFTNSRETLAGQVSVISAWNFFVRVNAGDFVEIYWSSPSTDVIIEYSGAQTTPTRPETPSVILTVNKIIS